VVIFLMHSRNTPTKPISEIIWVDEIKPCLEKINKIS
jgi:hypothetical protein